MVDTPGHAMSVCVMSRMSMSMTCVTEGGHTEYNGGWLFWFVLVVVQPQNTVCNFQVGSIGCVCVDVYYRNYM